MDFTQVLLELDVDYIFIEISTPRLQELKLYNLEEGKWVASKRKGWSQRVDPENPQIKILRHVHVARDKHISTKQKQVAWNDDHSRHDRKSFNQNLSGIETAKNIARDALGLPSDVVLEAFTKAGRLIYLTESTSDIERSSPIEPIYFSIK